LHGLKGMLNVFFLFFIDHFSSSPGPFSFREGEIESQDALSEGEGRGEEKGLINKFPYYNIAHNKP